MKRTVALALLGLSLSTVPVYASDTRDITDVSATVVDNGAATVTETAPATVAANETAAVAPAVGRKVMLPAEWVASRQRPKLLPALYAGLASLQMFDAYSTQRALASGAAHEANPTMKSIVSNPALFWGLKAGMAVAPMLAAERLWKTNKIAAIAVMAASNGIMAVVAAHNASVIKGLR